MQLTFDGKTIDQLAIELIQAYNNSNEPYYGGFSGGKDSVVIYDLTKRANVPVDWHYNVSPIDSQEVRDFIKTYYPDVIWDKHAQGFFGKLFLTNGAPLRTQRWCCRVIKECGGEGRVKILGMRTEESNTRKHYKCFMDNPSGGNWLLPIVNWTTQDIWQYIAERDLPINPLYKLGFERIGCVLCPFAGKGDIKLQLHYFPKIVNAYKMACNRYIENRLTDPKRKEPKHKTGEEYFNWCISRK
ncbi:MAG: phosphoadenosine phosphosulfate reductase family protein [Dehalococcoidales bacterium]|nr:phosphoadenosine phosphosulfate reductase family protein [Dehalococcoidales bacterium]